MRLPAVDGPAGLQRKTALLMLLQLLAATLGWAAPSGQFPAPEPKKSAEEKKPEPPRIQMTSPLAIARGTTNTVQVRGLNLTNTTELRLTNAAAEAIIQIRTSGVVEIPKDYDGKRIGDTEIQATVLVPRQGAAPALETNWLVAITPAGSSEPFPILVISEGLATVETEPNGGFQQAQTLVLGRFVLGTIKESGDVDVYRVAVRAGQEIRAELYAAPGGSMLDSLVTIVNDTGHPLAANDDASPTRDSRVGLRAPHDGTVSVVVQDANDKGGLAHLYVLHVLAR